MDRPPAGDVALLLHLDDLCPETLDLGEARVTRIAGLIAHARGAAGPVIAADREAMADALARASRHFRCATVSFAEGWADDLPVVTPWAPVGPSADRLPQGTLRLRRDWDHRIWPEATRGYFKVRSAIVPCLDRLGIA